MQNVHRTRQRVGRGRRPQAGFTLIELMVTVAVIAILAVVGVPAMAGMINVNRINTATDNMIASLQLARSEAIRRGARVTVCASNDGQTCASSTDWNRWIVIGRDNVASEGGSEVIDVIRDETTTGGIQLQGPADGIVFRSSGVTDGEETLVVCLPTSYPAANQREITVMLSGGHRTEKASGGGECP
ncbi:type IV fimbrial biogenesis protein FimT [Luteimonas sp. J16]|uniref:GspH/FimT family pseudopilin n=1 Tax=unclassified Luteimonas TaxID=2629088 RepID=UPI0004BC76AB|nr:MULTISPECIES: GspH/FimT family pseudopilin [unclassified Luteimonas]TWG90747.1 type IV fimbrial biogenesis protein FimT [Luteimonas sp. J16]